MVTKCARDTCTRKARPGRNRGLCEQHYKVAPLKGYVDATAARERLELLRSRGVTLDMIGKYGISKFGVRRIETAPRIRRLTEAKVFGIPIPAGAVSTFAHVDGLGTSRRVKALVAMGWPQSILAKELGTTQTGVSALTRRTRVTSETAIRVAELFDRLSMQMGPSQISRDRARAAGWVTALAWDDIDRDEQPNLGDHRFRRFDEKYWELRDLGYSHKEIADHMGITGDSLTRQMCRYSIETAGVVA